MFIEDFKEEVLQNLQKEEKRSDIGHSPSSQNERIHRVVDLILTKIVDDLFDHQVSMRESLCKIPLDSKAEIFNACLGIQRGEGDAKAIIQIAKHCAQQDGAETALRIQNFGIKDQAALVEILNLCLEQNLWRTVMSLPKFGIQDQATLVKIAKRCVQKDVLETISLIQSFGIHDEEALVEIAKACAQRNPRETMAAIQSFGIKSEAARIEIVKICAELDGSVTASNIQKSMIQDPVALAEIARLCVKQTVFAVIDIQNFQIQDQTTLIEISELGAQKDPAVMARFIQNLGIKSPKALVQIAKFCAQRDGEGTAQYIQNFGIQDQDTLIEIAKLCAQRDGGGTAKYIKNFGIKSLEDRVKIAKICAQRDGGETAANVKNFEIEDQAILVEIAERCARQDGKRTALHIQKFGIQDLSSLFRVGVSCITNTPEFFTDASVDLEDYFWGFPQQIFEHLSAVLDRVNKPEFTKNIGQEFCADLGFVADYADKSANVVFVRSLCFYCLVSDKADLLKSVVVQRLLHGVLDFRVPFLKSYLFQSLIEVLSQNRVSDFEAFTQRFQPSTKPQKKRLSDVVLLTLFCAQNLEESLKVRLGNDFVEKIKPRDSFLPLASKTGALIEFVRLLNEKVEKGQEQISREFLSYNQGSACFSQQLFIAQAALILGINIADMKASQVRSLVYQHIQIPQGFEEILEKLRRPESLFVYCGRISTLSGDVREQVQKTMTTYLQEVADKTFYERRYEESPQLKSMKKLFCQDHDEKEWDALMKKWKTKQKQKFGEYLGSRQELLAESIGSMTDEFAEYVIENTDDHWDLFLSGSEVVGSCQGVDANPELSKSLLGYVVDGKIRMIAIKDGSGRIVARSIIKLLWDNEQKKPVLFLEPSYANNGKLSRILGQMAKEEAERLGVELVTTETGSRRQFLSYTNRSGFEYEDLKNMIVPITV